MLAQKLLKIALPLTFAVIVGGAFTRLSDAGLGCPDWPGCYGQLIGVPDAQTAAAHSPQQPLESYKAWVEVAHRYIAAFLGVIFLIAAVAGWRQQPRFLTPLLLLALTVFQGGLGRLTVTESLRPSVVVAHLLGALLILFVLSFALGKNGKTIKQRLCEAEFGGRRAAISPDLQESVRQKTLRSVQVLRRAGIIVAVFLAAQIFFGGWVSANYAGLACPDFPLCGGKIVPPTLDFSGFGLGRELHKNADGAPIHAAALTTIHWTHRIGAAVLTIVVVVFAALLFRAKQTAAAAGLLLLLILQLGLGIGNVVFHLPLSISLAHSAINAMLTANVAALLAKL